MDKITQILENVVRCKYFEVGVHIKNPIKNSYQDGLGGTIQTSDHVVVVHILIWDKRKSLINKYSDWIWTYFNSFRNVCHKKFTSQEELWTSTIIIMCTWRSCLVHHVFQSDFFTTNWGNEALRKKLCVILPFVNNLIKYYVRCMCWPYCGCFRPGILLIVGVTRSRFIWLAIANIRGYHVKFQIKIEMQKAKENPKWRSSFFMKLSHRLL